MQRPNIVNSDGWVNVDDLDPATILYHLISDEEAQYVGHALPKVKKIGVIDVKGGVRKTTAAVNIALGLARYDPSSRVLGADCDQYHSMQDWADTAAQSGDPWPDNIRVASFDGPNFHFDVIDAAIEYGATHLVLDTPPNDEAAARRALLHCDAMLTPTGPFPMDIRRLVYGLAVGVEIAEQRGRPIAAKALITGTKIGSVVYREARAYLRSQGLDFFNMPIRDLLVHATAFGTSVPEPGDYLFLPDDLVPWLDATHHEGN